MIRNYWITKDCFDRVVNIHFVEPTLNIVNTILHIASKEDLRCLLTMEAQTAWEFEREHYRIVVDGGRTELFMSGHSCPEYIYTDLFHQALRDYINELQKMEDYFKEKD